jgi:hypothetical protein
MNKTVNPAREAGRSEIGPRQEQEADAATPETGLSKIRTQARTRKWILPPQRQCSARSRPGKNKTVDPAREERNSKIRTRQEQDSASR